VRILVTNDDGIHADGLAVCEAIAHAVGAEVWTVAPESDQSGVAHSLSLNDPLRLRAAGPQRFAVLGTPTDCVIMALKHIMPSPPDLILSGVNRGQNVAEDVTYSGTVAAAMEGTILGVPSIALSQAYGPGGRENIFWSCAQHHAPALIIDEHHHALQFLSKFLHALHFVHGRRIAPGNRIPPKEDFGSKQRIVNDVLDVITRVLGIPNRAAIIARECSRSNPRKKRPVGHSSSRRTPLLLINQETSPCILRQAVSGTTDQSGRIGWID